MSKFQHFPPYFVSKPQHILTECLLQIVENAPETLKWNKVKIPNISDSACYEAVYRSDLFSVNLLTGSVLVNGAPPGLLPASITSEPLYGRTFGRLNFEVVSYGCGNYKTARSVLGNLYYKFEVGKAGQLHIIDEELIFYHGQSWTYL